MSDICALIDTDYGKMIVPCQDINQTGALLRTRKSVHHESVEFLNEILDRMPAGKVFVDAGANIGCFTLGCAPHVDGMIHAFEAQPVIANMLAGSIALSQRENIRMHNICLGDRHSWVEVPQFDYRQRLNFGSIEFGPEQIEHLDQKRGNDPDKVEYVEQRTLDSYFMPRVDLIKVDIQRMEVPFLKGAIRVLRNHRPTLFIEWVGHDIDTFKMQIEEFGYSIARQVQDDWLCVPV